MKRILALQLLLIATFGAVANDGVFCASGNQLIPVTETDIKVIKEILSLEMDGGIKVTVYYEFFNPAGEKDLLVGFEAPPPNPYLSGQFDSFPEHPYIRGFNVKLNGTSLSWQVAHVEDVHYGNKGWEWPPYYKNGRILGMTRQECYNAMPHEEWGLFPFAFVYYFNARFKPGLNIIEHTYTFDTSGGGPSEWDFEYILTAACRWANRQIDDFTLHINMGNHITFVVAPSFFNSYREWTFDGAGKLGPEEYGVSVFHVREGGITFHKKNFRPRGELSVSKSSDEYIYMNSVPFRDAIKQEYRLVDPTCFDEDYIVTSEDKRILRNLPFAFRGYVFKTPALQRFFESTEWYIPNPSYSATMDSLTKDEKAWVQKWSH